MVAQVIADHPLFKVSTLNSHDVYLALVSNWRFFHNLGFADFRRLWLSGEVLWATLAICREDIWPPIYSRWHDIERALGQAAATTDTGASQESADAKSIWQLSASPEATELGVLLAEKIAMVSRDRITANAVGGLMHDLSNHPGLFSIYPDASNFLQNLSQRDGHTLYIVTEGDEFIQRLKFRRLGLERYIALRRLVTTDDLCHPPQLRQLRTLATVLEERLGRESNPRRTRYGRHSTSPRTALERQRASQHVEFALANAGTSDPLAFLDSALAAVRFLAGRISIVRLKGHPAFLPLLIHSIWRSPSDPHKGFRQVFSNAPLPPRRLKLAVVGDRYDADLYPALSLLGDAAITVRLRRGKYEREYLGDDLAAERKPSPTATFETLRDAKQMLTDERVWARARPVDPPSLASLVPEPCVDFWLGLCLLFPEDSAAHRVAASIRPLI